MKKLFQIIPLPALLLALVMCGCASRVVVREYEHPQWGNVIHLANRQIEAIIAPERGGRLMHYSRLGESNLLWTAADINSGLGKGWKWQNWGGEKTWLWPQSAWPEGTWPPPLEFDQEAFEVYHVGGDRIPYVPKWLFEEGRCVFMHTPKKEINEAKNVMRRIIYFPEKGSKLSVFNSSIIFNCWSTSPPPLSVWSVTQIPMPEKIILERTAPRRLLLQMPNAERTLVMSDENTVDLSNVTRKTKGMMDANGFRVPTAQGTLVVRQSGIADIPYDEPYRAQICTSPFLENDAYVELEFAAPLPADNKPAPSSQTITISLEKK